MPRNRRARRAFDKKYRSGIWKACAGASAMAAVIAVQTGVAPAFAAPTTRYVDLNVEDNGTSALSLREAIALANPGDIIDISGAGDDIWVDGTITIDTELTIVGAGDGVQKIHSYAHTASNWGFNDVNLGLGNDVPDYGAGDDSFNNLANNTDTIVGNTIFNIVGQIDNATEDVIESTITFKDVSISGNAWNPQSEESNYVSEGQYHNYTALVTVDETHRGEVIFDAATLEDSYLTTMAKGYELFNDRENMYVWLASGSGLASYSGAEGDLTATNISFINDSQIYNLNTNTVVDWDDQFQTKFYEDSDDEGGVDFTVTKHWDSSYYDGFDYTGSHTYVGAVSADWDSDRDTASAVFSVYGNVTFSDSSAESNGVYTADENGTWNLDADGAVFGLYEGNLTIVDSTIQGNYNEFGDGGVAYLDEGNLYIYSTIAGQSDISYNTAQSGMGGAFNLDDGKFDVRGDVVFENNWADFGGAIASEQDGNEYFSFVGDGVEFNNNKAEYDGGALYVDGWLRIQGQADGGVDFDDNIVYDGEGGAIYQYDGYLEIKNANFTNNEAQDDGGEGYTGRGGAIFAGVQDNGVTKISLSNIYFNDNTAEYSGGAIAVDDEDFFDNGDRTNVSIAESVFSNNYSGDEGGAIYFNAVVNAEIADSYFVWNESDEEGAAVFFNTYAEQSDDTYLNILGSEFKYNRTDRAGGAVFTWDALTVENSNFISNISEDSSGGAIFADEGGFVRTSYFTGNMADYYGGAIYSEDSVLAVYESEFYKNGWDIRGEGWIGHPLNALTYENTNDGGAIHSDGADLLVVNSHFENNYASQEGGALSADSEYEAYANIRVVGTSFVNNYADNEGSAIYAEENIYVINSTFTENEADSDDYVVYSDDESVYIAMSTFVNNEDDGEGDSYIAYAEEDIHIFGSIVADSSNDLILDEDSDFYDDGYNIVTDPDALQNDGMLLGIPLDNKSMYVNWSDLDFAEDSVANWGSYAETMKLGAESIAIRYIRGNRVDVDWLNAEVWFPKYGDTDRAYKSIYSLIEDDARGTHRGNLMDAGSYEASIMSGGGGSVDASPSEPVVEPTPTPTPEVLTPVVANVRGFAPGSAKLSKALKATIKDEVTKNSAYKAVVLRGFTVTAADFALAKARATAVKNYILKLVPDLATKVLKGKLGQSRKVKLTFKETL